ncbi:putative Calmodulin-binding domain, plant [Helianthus annuus]|nr:putative Calmodulin-binding domain, plant [Helianthus annuus]KAJ0596316.1 putative Calmodulin-binding domain, plant [Helianthus annuus]KAJ0930517.1 putative Calmodulin-binding domain, plant [Helianthus annuus]
MEKTVPNKHSRRHSTGNFYIELTGYEDVLSRYLSPPFPSCHDNCKPHPPWSDPPTQPKPTRKRSNKTDGDSPQGTKKPFTPIPRSPTRHAKITSNSLPKHQVKSQPLDSKSQDFKSKSKSEETDPFYIQPSRITRRFSDVNLHTNDLALGGLVRSSKRYDKKIDSRKDVKPVKSSVTTPGDGIISKKAQALKTLSGSTKKTAVDHDSKKSKSKSVDTVGEVVQEKNKKSQSPNEEKVLKNGTQIDETPGSQSRSQSQNNGNMTASGVKKTENSTRVRKPAKENEELSSQKLKFKQGKTIGSQSESNGPRKAKFEKGKVLDKNQTSQEDSKSLRRLTSDSVSHTPESNSVSVALKACDVEVAKPNIRLNNVIEETASRLIRTRKSKVQALVGAFEMISSNEF